MTRGLPLFFAQLVGASFIIISGISSRLMFISDNFLAKFFKTPWYIISICLH